MPQLLPNLLFKLNEKHLDQRIQNKRIEYIIIISKRMNGFIWENKGLKKFDENLQLVPLKVLLKMLIDHMKYQQKERSFFISPFFMNFCLSFVKQGIENVIFSLINNTDKDASVLEADLMNLVFELATFLDFNYNLLQEHQKVAIFHIFIMILPHLQYCKRDAMSTNEIKGNVSTFLKLFTIKAQETSEDAAHILKLIEFIVDFLFCRYSKETDESKIKWTGGICRGRLKLISKNYALIRNEKLLMNMQLSLIEFLYFVGFQCNLVTIQSLYLPALVGLYGGCGESIKRVSEKLVKKIQISEKINFEDERRTNKLITLYLGSKKCVDVQVYRPRMFSFLFFF